MHPVVLPPELQVWSHLRFVRKRGRYEYSSECPVCGDSGHMRGSGTPDRFRMFAEGNNGRPAGGWCRQCGHFQWANSEYDRDPIKMLQVEIERKRLAKEQQDRMQRKIERIAESEYWRGWHEAMGTHERQLWEAEGIPASLQNYWELGYKDDHQFFVDDYECHSPAMTIPYFVPSADGRQIATIQYRLLDPPEPSDKYRFTAELSAPLYLPDAYQLPYGSTLLVEGGKKAMIAWLHLGDRFQTVAAIPSKYPSQAQLDSLNDCEPIIVAIDPDGNERLKDGSSHAERIVEKLGAERCLIAHLPEKIDDMIVKYGVSPDDVYGFIRSARPKGE